MPLISKPKHLTNKTCQFWFVSLLVMAIAGCGKVYTVHSSNSIPISLSEFNRLQGYQLEYDLFLPGQINGWLHSEKSKFIYDPKTKAYWLKNIALAEINESMSSINFKISNVDWHHQFGFGNARYTPDDSIYSVPSSEGITFQLLYSNNASNLTLELPANSDSSFLSFAIKVTETGVSPKALLYTVVSKDKIK